jgi:hypothetical protein
LKKEKSDTRTFSCLEALAGILMRDVMLLKDENAFSKVTVNDPSFDHLLSVDENRFGQ